MLVISDRVKESSITEGVGPVTLEAPFGSFDSFSQGIGDGNTTYYCIENGVRWEVGQGVYNSAGNTLSRDIVFDSSAGGAKIELEGPSVVFCTLPADRAIIQNEIGHTFVSGISTLELNASEINSNSINNSGEAAFAENVLISGDLALLGNFIFNGDLSSVNNITNSGDIVSSGFLTLVRPEGDAGNFFHAYKDDGTRQTVSLHVDNQISPLWKFGLKTNPNNQTDPPTFGYIFARDGAAGMVSNLDNYFSISDGLGFTVQNEAHNVLRASSLTGVYLETTSSVNPSFVITGPPLNAEDLTQWRQSDDTVLSVVDSGGKFGILNDTPEYELDVTGSGRMESIYLTSGIYFQDGTFQSSALTGGGTGDAVEVSGWADVTMTNRDNAVSGYFQTYVDSQDHSSAAVSGWADITMTQRDNAISGYLESYVDSQDHSASAVSGWADTTIANVSGWASTTIINGDNAVSGYFQTYTDNQDAAISGIAVYASGHTLQTVTDNGAVTDNEITINANFSAVSGMLSGIDFSALVEADHPPYQEGRVFYDAENHCVTVYNDESEISLQVGQEEYIRIRNNTGSTISNGKAVYITGAQGQHITVGLATASGELQSEAVGVATHDIEDNSFGYITTFGLVRGVNTTAFSEGDELFVSVTDGELTNTSPIAPNYKTSVGHVVVAGNNGSILVTPRDHKLGGGDAKTLGNIAQSGIVFFESITNDGDAGILASDPNFYFDQPNSRVQLDTGGLRFDDGTTQTTSASTPSGNPSGISFFDQSGLLTDDPRFVIDSGGNGENVYIGINSDGAPDKNLVIGNTKAFNNAGFELVNYARGNSLAEIVCTSGGRSAGIKFSNGTNDWWTGPLQNSLGGLGARHVVASYDLDNTKSMVYDTNGNVVIGGTSPGARLHVNSYSSSSVNTILQGAVSQSENLFELRNSADELLSSFNNEGELRLGDGAGGSGIINFDLGISSNSISSTKPLAVGTSTNYSLYLAGSPTYHYANNTLSFIEYVNGRVQVVAGGSNSVPVAALDVRGDVYVSGSFLDQDVSTGTAGQHLISTATGVKWTSSSESVSGVPSGVAFFGDDGTLSTQASELVYNSGTNQLLIGHDDWDKTKGAYADTDLITASGTIRATGLTINTGSRTFRFASNNFGMFGTSETAVTTYTNFVVGGLCIGSTYTSVVVGALSQTTYDAKFRIFGDDPTEPTSMVTAATLQTANMQEWQTNDETVVAYVSSDGSIASSGTVSATGDILTSGRIGVGTDSPNAGLEIVADDLRLPSDYRIEWGGSNNSIRGNSGGVGAGMLRFYAGSYELIMVSGDGSTNWLPPGETFYRARVTSNGDFSNNGDVEANDRCESFGDGAYVSGVFANAFGNFATAKGSNSPFAVGFGATAEGTAAIAIGYNALRQSDGNYKVGIGASAAYQALEFERSTAVGGLFCAYKASGSYHAFYGSYAGYRCSGNYNVGIGFSALRESTGSRNIEISNKNVSSVSSIGNLSDRLDIGDGAIRGDLVNNRIGINIPDYSPDSNLAVVSSSSSAPVVTVQGTASQVSPLQEWRDSSENPVARVQPSGMYEVVMASSGTDEFRLRFGEDAKEFTADAFVTGIWLDFDDGSEFYDTNNGMILGTWYNSSKTARSYLQIARGNFRVELGNGLRMITNTTSTRFNGDVTSYSSTPRQLGKESTPWGTGWFRDLSVSGILRASGDPGSAGQVLTSTGSSVYWSTPTASNRTYNNITADFSMSDDSDVVFMDTTSGPINVYLPTAAGQGGKEIMIKLKAGSDSGVLIGSGSQTIDGQSQFGVYNTYENITLISDNSNWFIS